MLNNIISDFKRLPTIVKRFVYFSVGLIFVIIIVTNFLTFANGIGARFFPIDARYEITTHGLGRIYRTRVSERHLNYFQSIEEAVDAYFFRVASITSPRPQRDEIIRFADEQGFFVVFVLESPVNNVPRDALALNFHLTDGDTISYPLYMWLQDIIGCEHLRRVYQDEDRVARDIAWSFLAGDVTSRVNNGIPIFYGVGVGAPPLYMSILGYEPDAIIVFVYNENEYFFWYYLDAMLFNEVFTRNFTSPSEDGGVRARATSINSIIRVFDIQFER